MAMIDAAKAREMPLPEIYGMDEIDQPRPSRLNYLVDIPAIIIGVMFIFLFVIVLLPVVLIRVLVERVSETGQTRRSRSCISSVTPPARQATIYSLSEGRIQKLR